MGGTWLIILCDVDDHDDAIEYGFILTQIFIARSFVHDDDDDNDNLFFYFIKRASITNMLQIVETSKNIVQPMEQALRDQ